MTPEIDIPKQYPHEGYTQIASICNGIRTKKWYEPNEAYELLKRDLFAEVIID